MEKFVHLHVHTQYSLLDGAAEIGKLVRLAREMEMPAVAITDHGVMYGCLKFYREARQAGIKPILGCEVYVAPRRHTDKIPKLDETPFHLVLLASNRQGYRNLLQLVSQAHLAGFYYKPRIDLELLRKYSAGLIGLSACLAGEIPRMLLANQYAAAQAKVQCFQEILGLDHFYLELQYQQLAEQRRLNRELARLGQECGAPLVATNDVHYLSREDAQVHDVLLCIQTGKTVQETNRLKFSTAEFYLKSPAEMAAVFENYPDAVANTLKIADQCQVELELKSFHMPDYPVAPEITAECYLERLCREGISGRQLRWGPQYEARLRLELDTINQMGFPGYFLVVWDFVKYAKEQRIMVGPGRGSAAGSLVAYLLGITDLDPLHYDLLFERFLNPERISMPDIDIDFCYERRGEVIDYVRKRYGNDRVAQIITFGTMAARAAVRDVGRALDLPYAEVDRVAKLIPHELGISIADALAQSPELTALLEANPQLRQLITIASQVEGFPRHASTHAAGVVIAPEPLTNFLPLALSNEDEVITQYPMEDIEALGLLKMDFLGLRTLTVLRDSVTLIRDNRGITVDIDRIPLDDRDTFALLQSGQTLGVFQLESRGCRNLLLRLKPEQLADLIAVVAFYRPGPLGSGMVEDYIQARHGLKTIKYLHPLLEPVLRDTYGVILYQEQVMRIASELGGFTLGEADLVRRAMGKKKPEVLAAMRQQFIDGALRRGVDRETAAAIFDLMEYFSGYGFNKSHSAAYGLVAYRTAYLKANYPQEYLAALLTSVMGNAAKIGLYIEEGRRLGIKLLHPDVNRSNASFTPEGTALRFGLMGIKNVGLGAIEKIVDERRQNGPYRSLADFCRRVSHQLVNRKVIESLIRSGAFDFTGQGRNALLATVETLLERSARSYGDPNQLNLLDEAWKDVPLAVPQVPEFSPQDLLQMEKEYLGVYLSGHPLDRWAEKFRTNGIQPLAELEEEPDGKEVLVGGIVAEWRKITTRAGSAMAGLRLEDWTGTVEAVIFPRLYEKIAAGFLPERVAVVKGRLQEEERGKKILASQLRWLGE
jgi:DNA polymerase-3 subunit alpha